MTFVLLIKHVSKPVNLHMTFICLLARCFLRPASVFLRSSPSQIFFAGFVGILITNVRHDFIDEYRGGVCSRMLAVEAGNSTLAKSSRTLQGINVNVAMEAHWCTLWNRTTQNWHVPINVDVAGVSGSQGPLVGCLKCVVQFGGKWNIDSPAKTKLTSIIKYYSSINRAHDEPTIIHINEPNDVPLWL